MTTACDVEGLLETNPHEFGVHLIFTEHDLKPYFAVRRVVQEHDGGGSELANFEHDDRIYTVSLGYSSSGFAPREESLVLTVWFFGVLQKQLRRQPNNT